MSITFEVNKNAQYSLGHQTFNQMPAQAGIDGMTQSLVEACGANHDLLIAPQFKKGNNLSVKDYQNLSVEEKSAYLTYFKDITKFNNSLMRAMHISFAQHYPLILTPDTVWLTIAQGLANHINQNSEALRSKFVSHQGKKLIEVRRDEFVKGSPDNDWTGCFAEFSDKIGEYIGKKKDLVVSNFSTTGLIEKAASELVLMDSMKSYFKYLVMTLCGIPSITLTGTVDDWRNIRTRVENFTEFDLDWWVKPLVKVMDHFVAAAEGNHDINFWDDMYKYSDDGSGGPDVGGWCNILFPYINGLPGQLRKNSAVNNYASRCMFNTSKYDFDGPGPTDFPSSLSSTPFKWQYHDVNYDMQFIGGLVGVHQYEDLSLEPAVGWAIREEGGPHKGMVDTNKDW